MKMKYYLLLLVLLVANTTNACIVNISSPSNSICIGGSVTLTATGAVTYLWMPGSVTGNTMTVSPVSTTTYTLTGTDAVGCIAIATKTITVNSVPVVSATASNDTICQGVSTALSANGASSYVWIPGSLPGQTISVSPSGNTTYTVTGTSPGPGCFNTATKTIVVKPAPKPILVDSNIFYPFSNCSNTSGLPLYHLNVSTPFQSTISSYSINWGDGTGSTAGILYASFPLSHNYVAYGVYSLIFTAHYSNGCSRDTTIFVINQTNPAIGIQNQISGSTLGCAPVQFCFKMTNYASNSPGTSYLWNFGDGVTILWNNSLIDSICHTYTTSSCGLAGNQFEVSVTAINACDSTKASINNIKVFTKPDAAFTPGNTSGCSNIPMTFINNSTLASNAPSCSQTTGFNWDFGDPASGAANTVSVSTLASQSHVYATPGYYTVRLIATGTCGSDTMQQVICIENPIATFTTTSSSTCAPSVFTFTNTSPGLIVCAVSPYTWSVTKLSSTCAADSSNDYSFISGTSTSSIMPFIRFNNQGTYQVRLTHTAVCGVFFKDTVIVIKRKPLVTIQSPTTICSSDTLHPMATVTNCGTNPLSYLWTALTANTGSPSAVTNPAFTFPAGTHTITLQVTNECGTTNSSITILVNPLPIVNITASPATSICAGQSVTMTAIGANTYSWSWPTGSATGSSITKTPLVSTSYTVIGTDLNACSKSQTITINVNPVPSLSVVTGVLSCIPGNDATIAITGSGGLPAYQYGLNGSYQVSNLFNGLGAGTYTVSIKDANNCTSSLIQNVVSPNAPAIASSSLINVSCYAGTNGSITVAGSGGTGSLQYILQPGTVTNSTGVFTNLAANSYTVIVKDAVGCTSSIIKVITQPIAPLSWASATATPVTCFGTATGVVNTIATGGTAPYTYTLQPGSVINGSGTFTGKPSGNYTVVVSDANGCTNSTVLIITQPAQLIWGLPTVNNVSCNGGANASISLTATGGSGSINYILLPTGTVNATGSFTGLNANGYTVKATDANGCSITSAVNISQPPVLGISNITSTSPSCVPGNDGSITMSGSGGTGSYQYAISPAFVYSASNMFTNLGTGTYTVMIKDASGCTASATQTIIAPNAPIVNSITKTDASCIPGNDGSISMNVSNGTTPYQYALNPPSLLVFQTLNTFNGLAAGTYTILVKDAVGCTNSGSIVVATHLPPIINSVSHLDASCSPGCDGSITISATGSSLQYKTNIGSFQLSPTLSALCANSYTVTVKDVYGCTATSSLVIATVGSLILTIDSLKAVSCNGGNNGLIDIAAAGGTGPIAYTLLPGGLTNSSGNYPSLSAGSYTVTATDANGCTKSTTLIVTQPALLIWGLTTSTNVSCNGGSNGTISTTASGGSGIVSYTLLPTGTLNASGSFANLTANVYTVKATDANGCSITSVVNISQPTALLIDSVTNTVPSCLPASMTIYGSGGTMPYVYSDNGISFSSSNVFVNLAAGIYTLTIKDAHACTTTTTHSITTPNAPYFTSILGTNTSCNGSNNGSISNLTASGGSGTFVFSILPSGSFLNLAPNTYTVIVADGNSCTSSTTLTITEPPAISLVSLTHTDITCHNLQDGSIHISCTGGSGVLHYKLLPSNITNVTGIFSGLSGNTYTVVVTDDSNCTYTTTSTILNPPLQIFTSVSSSPISCNGNTNATIVVSSNGGTGIPVYSILPAFNPTNTTGIFNSLPANSYTLTVTDINNCSIDTVVAISQPPPVIGSFILQQNVSCYGGNNGTFTVFANAGWAPFQYYLLGSAISNTTGVFNNMQAGTYSVQIVDSAFCSTIVSPIVVTQPSPLVWNTIINPLIQCFGNVSDSVSVNAVGGTGTLNNSIAPLGPQNNTSGNFIGLTSQVYTITSTDANNCTISTLVNVTQNPEVVFNSLTLTPPNCHGDNNGSILSTVSGGIPPLNYQLNGSPATSISNFYNLATGFYTLSVHDVLNCSKDTMLFLNEPDKVQLSELEVGSVICPDSSDAQIYIQGIGGTGDLTYGLLPDSISNGSGIFNSLPSGTYTLLIKDSMGCQFDTMVIVTPPLNPMSISISSQDLGCLGLGTEGWAEANVVGGAHPYAYLWNTTPPQVDMRATGLRFGYYIVQVIDFKGCNISDTVYIKPGTCCEEVFLPNAFSPNGDGVNDIFRAITSAGIQLFQFDIYNRWGELIWNTNDYTKGWDGVSRGANTNNNNTYYYIFSYKCLTDEKTYTKKGDVMVIR